MAKYNFRLQTVQKLRAARRDQGRASLAEAFRAEQILAENRAEVATERHALGHLQSAACEGRYLDVNRLLEVQRYGLILNAREQELNGQAKLLAIEIERRRQTLVEADREVRVLELLDEKHRQQHRRREQQLETKQLDEAALTRHRPS